MAKYGIIKETQPKFPVRELLKVPHQGKDLIVSYPAFGPNCFSKNIELMQNQYAHPLTKEQISFREATTAESTSASAYKFKELAKLEIFKPKWLQVGRTVRTSEGVFANPPRNEQGNSVINEKILKQYLNKAEKINGIYLIPNETIKGLRDFGFAPYEFFKQGIQSREDFAVNPRTNGLARVLEHTEEKVASGFKVISENYSTGVDVDVFGFNSVSEPIARISTMGNFYVFDGRLHVLGDWDDCVDAHAFGVYSSEKSK